MFRSALRAFGYLALFASAVVGLVLVAYRLDAPDRSVSDSWCLGR